MSGQLAEAGSLLSVVPIEPEHLIVAGTHSQRDIRIVAYGIAVSARSMWVVTTYATALVMAPDGTLVPLRDVLAEGEEVSGHVYT